jgi:hypothetical protein
MLALFLAVFLGLFPQPATRNVAAEVVRHEVVNHGFAPPPLARYDRQPVSEAAANAARAAVRVAKVPVDSGVIRHQYTFPDGTPIEFTDHPKKPGAKAKRKRVIQYFGSNTAAQETGTTFTAAGQATGLSPEATQALQFISQHEGGFDAVNTWDSARFSWGFIQFAGGRGLPPALALIKGESPKLFQSLFANYGVDVLPDANGKPKCVYVSAKGALYGKAAEQAYGDNLLVAALFIRAGRAPEVKQREVEAAIRNYAAPALAAVYGNIRVSDVLRSPQSLAMLIDRKVHEGNVARLGRAVEQAWATDPPRSRTDFGRMEARALDLAVQNTQDSEIRGRLLNIRYSSLAGPATY